MMGSVPVLLMISSGTVKDIMRGRNSEKRQSPAFYMLLSLVIPMAVSERAQSSAREPEGPRILSLKRFWFKRKVPQGCLPAGANAGSLTPFGMTKFKGYSKPKMVKIRADLCGTAGRA
jgi:hypothetical protein